MRLTAYLSGAENSLPDYAFPLSTFGLSKRDAAVSYYNASAPFSAELLQAFTDRPDGLVHILRDGAAWEYFNVGHPVQYDIGPRSATISLNGTRQETNTSPATIVINLADVESDAINSDGLLTLGLIPSPSAPRPGDTITYDGTDYLVTLAQFRAGVASQTLKINAQEIIP